MHRCVHWMAIFVIWFAALAPTLSQAFASPMASVFDEICTATGFVSASADGEAGPTQGQPGSGHPMGDVGHCPFCFLQGHAVALPSQPAVALAPAGLRFEMPSLFLQARHPLHAWASAQARAPPLSA